MSFLNQAKSQNTMLSLANSDIRDLRKLSSLVIQLRSVPVDDFSSLGEEKSLTKVMHRSPSSEKTLFQ